MGIIFCGLLLWTVFTCGTTQYVTNLIFSDLSHPPPFDEYPYPNSQVVKKLPIIKEKQLNESLKYGYISINALKRLEDNLKGSGKIIEKGSPEHGQLINGYPSNQALALQNLSSAIIKASLYLSHMFCGRFGISHEECAGYISKITLHGTSLNEKCYSFHHPNCNIHKKYRTYDGSCNNIKRKSWGKAFTGFKRLLHPKYADGIDKPRVSVSKKPLPHPRIISAVVGVDADIPDTKYTLSLMQWAQFLEHDLIHIPIRKMVHSDDAITCCDKSGRELSPRYLHPNCFSMAVSHEDNFYGPRWVTCLPYVRSITTFRSDCTFGAAEQMNQATHFLDGSHIYGANEKDAMFLRDNFGGLMESFNFSNALFLPFLKNSKNNEMCQRSIENETCFKSGDPRVNNHPYLTAMYTLWLREHNRIARKLAELNPKWNNEIIYQESRKIVIAELQHITYSHWLPKLIGETRFHNLKYSNIGYDPDKNPSISNSFATVGIRFFYSLLDGSIYLLNEDRSANETLEFSNYFNKPSIITKAKKYAQLIRGMITQSIQAMDSHIIDDVTQKLYSNTKKVGLDILSFDIQRGRDHGIPSYNQFRVFCGLKFADSFQDLSDDISEEMISQLKEIYSDVNDVDLIIGALSEKPKNDSFLGPTFSCLVVEQLLQTKSSDRYFYTNIDQPVPFTEQQLTQIKKTSLSRIICDNAPEIKSIQKDVFSIVSNSELLPCDGNDIKHVNLVAWQETSHNPDIIEKIQEMDD